MKRIVTIYKSDEIFALQFSQKDISMTLEQFQGIRFVPDSPGVHQVMIEGDNPLGIAQSIANWLTSKTGSTVFYEGGYTSKFGSGSASSGKTAERVRHSFSARGAGFMATSYLPSPHAS